MNSENPVESIPCEAEQMHREILRSLNGICFVSTRLDKNRVCDIIVKINIEFRGTSCLQRMLVPLCFFEENHKEYISKQRRLRYGNSTSGTY